MGYYDWIGFIAMGMTVISFIPNNYNLIRSLNSIACIVWIIYGALIKNYPTLSVNIIVLTIHAFWWWKETYKKK